MSQPPTFEFGTAYRVAKFSDAGAASSVERKDEHAIIRGVHILPRGTINHPQQTIDVDGAFIASVQRAHDHFADQGYYPPVLFEHDDDTGKVGGLVVRIYEKPDGVYADMAVPHEVADDYEDGELVYRSPSLVTDFECPQTGKTFDWMIREVSWTSVPHIKGLNLQGTPYDLSESDTEEIVMADEEKMDNEEPTEAEEQGGDEETEMMDGAEGLAAVQEALENLTAMVSTLLKQSDADDGETAEPPAEAQESGGESTGADSAEMSEAVQTIEKLSARVDELEAERDEAQKQNLCERIARDVGEDPDSDVVTNLAEASLNGSDIEPVVARMSEQTPTTSSTTENGYTGFAEHSSGPVTFSEAQKEARKAGKEPGQETIEYITGKYGKDVLNRV